MRTLDRNKRVLYVAKMIKNGSLKTYGEPTKYIENYQVTNTTTDINQFGVDAYSHIRIKTQPFHADYYHIGDRVYINVVPSEKLDKLAETADYEVEKEPIVSLNECEVFLKRRSGK